MKIQTWHDGRLVHGIHVHASVDDLDFDARVTVGRQRQKISVELSEQLEQEISIKLATTVGHFYVTLTLKNIVCGLTILF